MSIFSSYWGRAIGICFIATAMLAATPLASAQPAAANNVSFDIPAQNLTTALTEFARQSNQELFYLPEMAEGKTTEGVTGTMSTAAAMDALLDGTGLEFEPTPNGSLLIGDRATLDARRAEWQASAAGQQQQSTIGQRRPGIEEIIVTGQKREERIQDVPIAISAFSPEDLEAQKIEGGFDLLKGVPNVTFSKTNFAGYNFQIRGIGTQAVSATTDPGVAVSFNNTTLIVNRLFEQEYLDVERVEVLRGPQGTLYGRNATAGVINVISKKPELGVWDGMVDIEVGNYNTRRLRGFFNAPLGDTFAIRGAYASTIRDGYGINEAASDESIPAEDRPKRDVDDRDLWTGRLSLGWQPTDRFRADLIWERFEEDDRRVRTSKQLCHTDSGAEFDSFDWSDFEDAGTIEPIWQDFFLSQGCKAGSLYDDGAYGVPNGSSLPYISGFFQGSLSILGFGLGGNPLWMDTGAADCPFEAEITLHSPLDLCQPDPYDSDNRTQSRDLRKIYSQIEPRYRAEADIFHLSLEYELSDELLLSSETVYASDSYYATQDFNRYTTVPVWNDSRAACTELLFFEVPDCAPAAIAALGPPAQPPGNFADGFYADLAPDGVFCDPQLGCSRSLVAQDLVESESRQYNQELRLVSSYAGDWNFSLGANFTRFRTQTDYYVFANALTYLTYFFPFDAHNSPCVEHGVSCTYVDPNPLEDINGEGHNYFRSANPYKLTSSAVFGELYWNATDTVKVTAGLRFTWDRKVFTPVPSQLLLSDYREALIGADPDNPAVDPGDGPEKCRRFECQTAGNTLDGRGYVASPDIVQEWHEPTGRLVVDWQPVLDFTDETLVYASFSRGYKGGGANPPSIAPPAGLLIAEAQGDSAPPTFEAEYVNAYELGTKNTLFGGAVVLNGAAFYYDYTDYQVSKIVDRSAANENFDAKVWGLELETIFAPSLEWQFNAAIGYLNTEVAEGETSIDLMDRTDGGDRSFTTPDGTTYDGYVVLKPFVTRTSNCVAPRELIEQDLLGAFTGDSASTESFCPLGSGPYGTSPPFGYNSQTDAPNKGAGFAKDLGGNELPNSPHFTVALGGQYNFDLTRDWRATARVDYYWQDQSYARIYNFEPYDRLRSWSNTNLSFWINNPVNGITVEAYVKNVFDETPITGSFLNSDDSGLTTNVFTLDPRLIGVSVRKEF